MSFVRSEKHPNPDDPLYYAPRSVRSEENPRYNSAPDWSEEPSLPTPPIDLNLIRCARKPSQKPCSIRWSPSSFMKAVDHVSSSPLPAVWPRGSVSRSSPRWFFSSWFQSYRKAPPRNSPLSLLHRLDRPKQLKRRPNNPKRCFKNSCSGSKSNSPFIL